MLAYMYRKFAADYTVYLFDRRPVVPEGFTVREMAGDIADAMDGLGLADADVIGVSQGGMVAQYLALDRPDLVHKLVLAVTLSRNNDTVRAVLGQWIQWAEEGSVRELVADMAGKMYSAAYVRRYRPFLPILTLLQRPKDICRFVNLTRACLTCNTYDDLHRIGCPVLVVGGSLDQVVTGAASEEMAQRLGCRIHMYEDLGHAAYEEAADFNQIVFDFLME